MSTLQSSFDPPYPDLFQVTSESMLNLALSALQVGHMLDNENWGGLP